MKPVVAYPNRFLRRVIEIADVLGFAPGYAKIVFWTYLLLSFFLMGVLAYDAFYGDARQIWGIVLTLVPNFLGMGYVFYWFAYNKTRIHVSVENKHLYPNGFPWESSFLGKVFRVLRILLACWAMYILFGILFSEALMLVGNTGLLKSYFEDWFLGGFLISAIVFSWPLHRLLR